MFYNKSMDAIQVFSRNQCAALLLSRRQTGDLLSLVADLALSSPLRVVDGGNLFNVLVLSRTLRRKTSRVVEALNRIYISRAFTCYQMEAMLAEPSSASAPLVVLDLLGTFYDESVNDSQSRRLLGNCLAHLKRVSAAVPVLVSVFPARQAGKRTFLLEMLLEGIDQVWQWESQQNAIHQPTLWEQNNG